MLQIGTTYGSSTLGAQRHPLATAILKGVGLLLYYVRTRADSTNKKSGIFKDGCIDALIAITLANISSPLLDIS